MAIGARIENLEALRSVRIALVKFAEEVMTSLADADAELHRTMNWLETEQIAYWRGQEMHRGQAVAQAREAVLAKTAFKTFDGRTAAAIDEKKALAVAMRQLQEAEAKIAAVKKWAPRLKKEILSYRGAVARLAGDMESDVPLAMAKLDNMVQTLEAYFALDAPSVDRATGPTAADNFAGRDASAPPSSTDASEPKPQD